MLDRIDSLYEEIGRARKSAIQENLKDLGIMANVNEISGRKCSFCIDFLNETDLNLYKIAGTFKKSLDLEFKVITNC